jgi:DNA polymerase (family 10)
LAGSARRRKDTIGDLDVVVAVDESDHEAVANAILNLPGIADVKGAGDSKISLILDTSIFDDSFTVGHIDPNVLDAIGGDDYEQLEATGTIDAQVRLVPQHVEPFTLAYFTGSRAQHCDATTGHRPRLAAERIRTYSRRQGWRTQGHGRCSFFPDGHR